MSTAKIYNYCKILPIACEKPKVIVRKDMNRCLYRFNYVVIAGVIHESKYFIENHILPDIKNIHISEENTLNALIYMSNRYGFAELRPDGSYYMLETFWKLVPCGHCSQCRYNKTNEWCTRVLLELHDDPNAHLITLTFDNEHLPEDKQLHYEYFQKFLKRLRITIERRFKTIPQIRYVCCGEYGHLYHRPHFHTIIWGLPDLRKSKYDFMPYYERVKDFITPIWSNGLVHVGHEVSGNTIRYITKYMLKDDDWAKDNAQIQPFFKASRRPGIGGNYFTPDRLNDIVSADDLKLHISINGVCLDLALSGYCKDKVYKSNSKITIPRITDKPLPPIVTGLPDDPAQLDPYRLTFSKYLNIMDCAALHRAAALWCNNIIILRNYTSCMYEMSYDLENDPLCCFPKVECKSTSRIFDKVNSLIRDVDIFDPLDKLITWRNRFNDIADFYETYLSFFALPEELDDVLLLFQHYEQKVNILSSFIVDSLCEGTIKDCDLYISSSIKNKKQTIHYLTNVGKDGQ